MKTHHCSIAERYDLRELGLIDPPPFKAAAIVVETARETMRTDCAAFVVFDEQAGEAIFHAVSRRVKLGTRLPLHASAVARARDETKPFFVPDLSDIDPLPKEKVELGFSAMLAAPVLGPDNAPIGALGVFDTATRERSDLDLRRLENLAYLITQEVMLRASFATLEIMASQRPSFRA